MRIGLEYLTEVASRALGLILGFIFYWLLQYVLSREYAIIIALVSGLVINKVYSERLRTRASNYLARRQIEKEKNE